MSIVLRAFPIRRPLDELQRFIAALEGERKAATEQFYKHYGVSHESWHLQETPSGPWVIALAIVDNPTDSGARYAAALGEYESWFKAQVLDLTGIDANVEPLGPPTKQVFAWSDPDKPNAALL